METGSVRTRGEGVIPLSRRRISIEPSTWTSSHTGTSEGPLMKRETIQDVVAADGLQALLTRLLPRFLRSFLSSQTFQTGAERWISPAFFGERTGEARSTGLARCFLPVTPATTAELGRKKGGEKSRGGWVKSASILLHARERRGRRVVLRRKLLSPETSDSINFFGSALY